MTFLDIVQRLKQDCSVSGTGPITTINQVGDFKRLVDYVIQAWIDIQSLHQDWKFLRLQATWTSIDGQASYTTAQCGIASGTFSRWVPEWNNLRGYLTSVGTPGEFYINEIPYESYKSLWGYNTNRDVKSQPSQYAITPDNSITFGPKPPSGYTFLADYYRATVTFSANADVPALPPAHSPLIIMYRAMMLYGVTKAAPELFTMGSQEYKRRLALLRQDQLPAIRQAGALA